jgi:hypothetical protein
MLVGDFNGSMEAGKRGSVKGMGLWSPLTTALLPGKDYYHTFFRDGVRVSRVDYALHTHLPNEFTVSEIGTHKHCSMMVFDHRPVWLHMMRIQHPQLTIGSTAVGSSAGTPSSQHNPTSFIDLLQSLGLTVPAVTSLRNEWSR